jgi:hypothetical protein
VSFYVEYVIQIIGAALIGTGAYLVAEKDTYVDLCDDYSWATGANLLLAVGVIILVIAFFGCFGAWKQSSILLGIVSSILCIINYFIFLYNLQTSWFGST